MICPRCGTELERRKHGPNETAYLRRKYHFSEWDGCPKCGYIQFYEKYKVRHSTIPYIPPKEPEIVSKELEIEQLRTDMAKAAAAIRAIIKLTGLTHEQVSEEVRKELCPEPRTDGYIPNPGAISVKEHLELVSKRN